MLDTVGSAGHEVGDRRVMPMVAATPEIASSTGIPAAMSAPNAISMSDEGDRQAEPLGRGEVLARPAR